MKYKKYPRTKHLPWSEGVTSDDKINDNIDSFINTDIIISLKMDGENCTMYNDKIHARSIDSKDHVSRHWVKNLHNSIKHNIPNGIRICGENMFAKHSIYYDDLQTYFYVFNIWDNDICLSWEDTVYICKELNLLTVPVIYQGIIKNNFKNTVTDIFRPYSTKHEGYVVRKINSFTIDEFSDNIVKWVRRDHVSTSNHWMSQSIIPNLLKKGDAT